MLGFWRARCWVGLGEGEPFDCGGFRACGVAGDGGDGKERIFVSTFGSLVLEVA